MLTTELISQIFNIWSEAYVVGGFLRERWFGKLSPDIDLLVSRNAIGGTKILANYLKKPWFPLDEKRDIARLILSDQATLDIAVFAGKSLEEDLIRRDITINAMAMPLSAELFDLDIPFEKLPIIDPTGAVYDLKNGYIRGLSKQNFIEDPLRILRVFRFCATYGFSIEEKTLRWMEALNKKVPIPAAERILQELDKLIAAPYVKKSILQMIHTGVLKELIIEVNDWDFNEWTLLLDRWKKLEQVDMLINIWETEHIEQLKTYFNQELSKGQNRFHLMKWSLIFAERKQSDWMSFSRRLKMTNKVIQFVNLLIKNHKNLLNLIRTGADTLKRHHFFIQCHDVVPALILQAVCREEINLEKEKAIILQLLNEYFDPLNPVSHPRSCMNGDELQKIFKLKPGPLIGELIKRLQEAQALNLFQTKAEALDYIKELLSDQK